MRGAADYADVQARGCGGVAGEFTSRAVRHFPALRRPAVVHRCSPEPTRVRIARAGPVARAAPSPPARQHGRGIFFQPGIQQLRDLLAEIGRVAEPQRFVALQRIAGSGEKKAPGRLGFVGAHNDLHRQYDEITSLITTVDSTYLCTRCGKARHFLGLSEHSWVNWSEEVRRRVGKELLRRGMFPPRKYFSNAA
jgi:hypothetical protein